MALVLLLYATSSLAEQAASLPVVPPDTPVAAQQVVADAAGQSEQTAQTPVVMAGDQDASPEDAKNRAMASAVADGVTTGLAISAGGLEANPLISTSPIGLVAVTAMKLGVVQYADTLSQEDKRVVLKSGSALWGGAAVNNIMVLLAAPPPFPIVAGLIMGIATWSHMGNLYEREDMLAAADRKKTVAEEEGTQATTLVEAAALGN